MAQLRYTAEVIKSKIVALQHERHNFDSCTEGLCLHGFLSQSKGFE